MGQSIPDSEVTFDPHSLRDHAGRVFHWRGRLYRAIRASHAGMFRRLFREGIIQDLVDRGLLIETELTGYELDGYELVVEHRRVPFVSYPTEWSAAMLRDAALLTLEMVEALAAVDLTLRDPHPWNLLFDGFAPVHIDLTSIAPLGQGGTWTGRDEFLRDFLHPLLLMDRGRDQWARWLMSTDRGAWRRDVIALAPTTAPSMLADLARSQWTAATERWGLRRSAEPGRALASLLKRFRRRVDELATAAPQAAEGGSPAKPGAAEQRILEATLARLKPESVLCIDSDPLDYPRLAARSAQRVVSFDTRLQAATRLYREARAEALPILSLVMDFAKPTPSYGLFDHHFVAATQRFQCDMVVAPRLARHLRVPDRRLDCEQVIDGMSLYSKRWLLAGYVPLESSAGELPDGKLYDSLESFTATMRRRFRTVDVIPFEPAAGALLVCEK